MHKLKHFHVFVGSQNHPAEKLQISCTFQFWLYYCVGCKNVTSFDSHSIVSPVSKIGFSIKRKKEKIMSEPSMSFIAEEMHESNLNVPDPVKAYFYLISGVCFSK